MLVGTGLAIVGATALMLAPVQAGTAAEVGDGYCETSIHHPSDPDAFGSGSPNSYACEKWNYRVRACDRHVDGHQVWAGYEMEFAPGFYWTTAAAPSGGCVTQGAAGNILRYRVCVTNEGCSAFRRPY